MTPLAAVCADRRGDGPDLGGTLEFRLSIAAAYVLGDKSRLGLQIAHLSNGGLYHRNPDDNEVLVTYSFPCTCRSKGLASFALPPTGCADA